MLIERPNYENDPIPIDSEQVKRIDAEYIAALEAERDQLVATLASVHGWLMRRVVCQPKAEIEKLFTGTEYESRIHLIKRKG